MSATHFCCLTDMKTHTKKLGQFIVKNTIILHKPDKFPTQFFTIFRNHCPLDLIS